MHFAGPLRDEGDLDGVVEWEWHGQPEFLEDDVGGAGLLGTPMPSSGFRKYGASGRGKWITVYARNGHTFAEIAGLRLDTTAYNTMRIDRMDAPRWRSNEREARGFEARHPQGL